MHSTRVLVSVGFIDKNTGKSYQKGQELDLSEERAHELIAKRKVTPIVAPMEKPVYTEPDLGKDTKKSPF